MASRQRTTFQKRQKEAKRLEKQRMKADRRAQKSLSKRAGTDIPSENETAIETPAEPETQG